MGVGADHGLAQAIAAALPQTQCTRCGYPDCQAYAEAVACAAAAINRCPPGGAEGVARLAALTGRPVLALDPACGSEGPRQLALIDEDWCIGCTLCIQACPVDAIAGAPKRMHSVVAEYCTGCALCLPPCPTDCIAMIDLPDPQAATQTGWQAWSAQQADESRQRYAAHQLRQHTQQQARTQRLQARAMAAAQPTPASSAQPAPAPKADLIAAALEKARLRQAGRSR